MNVEVTILVSSFNTDEKEIKFISFIASNSIGDSSITTLKSRKFAKEDEEHKEKLLDTYNEHLREYIILEKA